MYATRKHKECATCGTADYICAGRALTGEPGRCCTACRSAGHPEIVERTESAEVSDLRSEVPAADIAAEPMSRAMEDATVAAILQRAADRPLSGIEVIGQPAIEAYQALAASRGATLEEVVRAAYRDKLIDIVRRPVAATTTTTIIEETDHA